MIPNYLDKSAKVIRFKVRRHGSEGERREELIRRHSLGGSSCHLQEQSLNISPFYCCSHRQVHGVRLSRSEALFPCVTQVSLNNALAESLQSLKCLEDLTPEPKRLCTSGRSRVYPVSLGYVLRLVWSMDAVPSGSAVGLFSFGTCQPQDRAPTWKRWGSDTYVSRASNLMNIIILESNLEHRVTTRKP